MKKFFCQCGQPVFYDSNQCINCGALLGFDPKQMMMLPLRETDQGLYVESRQNQFAFQAQHYTFCSNRENYSVCNWLTPAESENPLCEGCQFNRTIPDLTNEKNIQRWGKFEIAKKRFLYTIKTLALPLENGFHNREKGLVFDFIEDQRSNPDRYPETFVTTGFLSGVVTVNAIEADDHERESIREAMNESYRTLLGHLRHESGHYFWHFLDMDEQHMNRFVELFGDPDEDYAEALQRHYEKPKKNWRKNYISAYASCHPAEDWAETWAHYMLIFDGLETAYANGLIAQSPLEMSINARVQNWADLSVAFNEMNRSIGLRDVYPFVVTAPVKEKIRFVDAMVNRLSRSTRLTRTSH